MSNSRHVPPLPTFIVIGAQKAGTTSLWSYLRAHPDVFVADQKELNFFIEEGSWGRGIDWYRAAFAAAGDRPCVGEVSPGYTMFPIFAGAPARMAGVVPDVRLVYLVREPIERMRSMWVQSVADGSELRPLREALLYDARYLALSQYATQVEQYLDHFDRDRLLVVRAEDLDRDPVTTLQTILSFIGADAAWTPPNLTERANVSAGKLRPRPAATLALRLVQAARNPIAAMRASQRLPTWARRPISAAEAVLNDDLRSRFAGSLEPEMARLRALLDPGRPLWNLATGETE